MKHLRLALRVGVLIIAMAAAIGMRAPVGFAAGMPELAFREVKITDTEFVVIQNKSAGPLQLNNYWLGYASDDKATNIVPTQQLPLGVLNPDESIILTNDAADTCDASLVSRLGFSSLGDSKGTLVIRQLQNSGTVSSFSTIDSVTWVKPSASATTTDNIDLRKESGITIPVWYRGTATGTWQVGDYSDCSLVLAAAGSTPGSNEVTQTVSWPKSSNPVPGVIVSLVSAASTGTGGKFLPAADAGLRPPQLSELLPNPAAPKLDDNDEFVELYNPNGSTFDLSGFTLQTGSTTSSTRHNYVFPSGTNIPANSFKAFYSSQTKLSLSNTGGQVWLLDPFGTSIAKTDPFYKPKDGIAWATVQGKWFFTVTPTPNELNRITEPTAASAKTSTSVAKTTQGVPVATAANSTAVTTSSRASYSQSKDQPKSAIHPLMLAGVVCLALLYGAYEYRHDLANRYHQLRANRTTRP